MTATCCRMLNRFFSLFITIIVILCTVAIISPNFSQLLASTSHNIRPLPVDFPIYPTIKPNVDFWIDIFAKYSASQGVMHDSDRLDIVYEVIKIDASATVRANRKNKRTKKAAIQKYKKILLHLSKGATPVSYQEKRIATLFGSQAQSSDFKKAALNIRCQTGLKEEFKRGLIRSGAVIDTFKKIFQAQGLPVDLVYLPCVESSYNFKAYSKFGAAGIWQFTRSTGRQYMKINYVVDERRDPYISTRAAARLLKKNYSRLKNWPMAITAYNHGLAGMQRAQKARGSYENIFKKYRSRSFKFASRNFYSEFIAARTVAKNSEKYFGTIIPRQHEAFVNVRTKGYLPIQELCDILDINIREIKRLNPSLRPPVFNSQKFIPKKFNLRLPATYAPGKVSKQLLTTYRKRQKPSRFHRVQRGDTAGSIARHNRIKLSDLILANHLNRRATIYIGQNLRIPLRGEIILAQKPKKTIRPSQKIATKKITLKKTMPYKTTTDKTTTDKETQKEPAPLKIALSEPPKIQAELQAKPIKDESPINPNIVTTDLQIIRTIQKKNLRIAVIRVEAEETLGHYADWLDIPTQEIRTLNHLKYGISIAVNQTIKIPMRTKSVQEFEELRYEFHKEIEEDFFESFSIQGIETYKVKNGDNIWTLCLNKLEIPFWLVKKYNPKTNFSTLYPKQKIHYPILTSEKIN